MHASTIPALHTGSWTFQDTLFRRSIAPAAVSRRPARRCLSAEASHPRHDSLPSGARFPINEGLPLSLFHPYKRLPPDGTTIPVEEERCDPEERKCMTTMHVYETRCSACGGSGWARAPSNGRRGQLGTCMLCHGLGYVRRTTARFCPDDPEHMTLVRPLSLDGKLKPRARQPQPQQQQQQQQQLQQQQRQQTQQQQPQQHQHQHQQQVQYKPGSSAQSRVDSSDNTDNTRKLP